ncbi:MAG TPA: hypothetical protein VH796_13560 [Nitrososphaeraceae archaeon]
MPLANGMRTFIPSKMFLKINTSTTRTTASSQSVNPVGNRECNLSAQVQQLSIKTSGKNPKIKIPR